MSDWQERLLAFAIYIALMSGAGFLLKKLANSLSPTGSIIYFVCLFGGLFVWWLLSRRHSDSTAAEKRL